MVAWYEKPNPVRPWWDKPNPEPPAPPPMEPDKLIGTPRLAPGYPVPMPERQRNPQGDGLYNPPAFEMGSALLPQTSEVQRRISDQYYQWFQRNNVLYPQAALYGRLAPPGPWSTGYISPEPDAWLPSKKYYPSGYDPFTGTMTYLAEDAGYRDFMPIGVGGPPTTSVDPRPLYAELAALEKLRAQQVEENEAAVDLGKQRRKKREKERREGPLF